MKTIGHCTQCDEPVFEVLATHATDHPKAGRPLRLGGLVDNDAVRITYVLATGTLASITFCGKCAASALDIKGVWRKCLALAAEEIRDARVGEDLNVPWLHYQQQLRDFTALTRNIPLGELYRERWKDLQDGRIQS